MKAKLLRSDNYKGRWFKLTKEWLYYCDGKLEVMLCVIYHHVAVNLLPQKHTYFPLILQDKYLHIVHTHTHT